MTAPRKCKCGNYIGHDTPANGTMCMECWCNAKNKPAGQQQDKPPPDRPGNPHATFDVPEHVVPIGFDTRMTAYMRMMSYDNIDNR